MATRKRPVAKAKRAKTGATARKRKPAIAGSTATSTGAHGVRIRMYRLGVGDCFLVSFPKDDGGTFRMLVDCGVHQSQEGGGERIKQVVADIKTESGGKLDVIVATHEHWDHLSGFAQAADLFKTLKVGEIWAAWTENANDAVARSLVDKRHKAIAAIGRAEARMRLASGGGPNRLTGLVGFFGDTTGAKLKEAGAALRSLVAKPQDIRYREPGEPPIELPGVKARVFVLGPPRDKDALKRSDPTAKGDEVYRFGAYGAALDALEPALAGAGAAPFDSRFAIPLSAARSIGFFQKNYWADRAPHDAPAAAINARSATRDRFEATQGWRRIDGDWLEGATSLALKLDEDTNNTSLVMAIELGAPDADGPVLLFAADAQVGNWLSWQNVVWPNVRGRRVTGPDLLRRTKVYKVGHHASHNATLRDKGLEMMDALELALVPTDAKMAKKVQWGTLPWKSLLDRLKEKTKTRVIRTDEDAPRKVDGYTLVATPLFYQVEF